MESENARARAPQSGRANVWVDKAAAHLEIASETGGTRKIAVGDTSHHLRRNQESAA